MMLPNDIERLGYGSEVIWLELEQEVMADIARRIKETGVITRSADYQLNKIQEVFGYSDQHIKQLLKNTILASDDYIDHVFDQAIQTDYIDNKKLYKAKGKEFIPYADNKALQTLVYGLKEQSKQMINFTQTLGFVLKDTEGTRAVSLTDYYKESIDRVMMQIVSGGFDSKTSLKKAVSEMTNSGLRWIDYETGHHSRVTVAGRRAVTTGLSQMTQKMSNYNAKQLGIDDFEVAWHANARPKHREWHGQVWSGAQLISVCGLGTVEGLCGANCYHIYYPFIKGLSKRNWTDEWLKEQNAKEDTLKEFDGKAYTGYEAAQRQRALETRMRAQREAIKLLKDYDGDELDILFTQAKYRATMDEYVKFSKAMDLREQRDRIFIDGKGKFGASRKKDVFTKQEYGSLTKYISSESYKINEKLRNKETLSNDDLMFVKTLDKALSKTKNYKGEVTRSVEFIFEYDLTKFIDMHKTNKPISYGQYISSTTNKVYNDNAQVQFTIFSKNGKDLRKYNSAEQEILFQRDVMFKVKHIQEKGGKWKIYLEEYENE